MDRKHLAMALSRVADPEAPESRREQVRTPGDLAADFLLHAGQNGDIEGRTVVDLGAGTGVLGIGALLMGARLVVAVEIEPLLVRLAQASAQKAGVADRFCTLEADVTRLEPEELREQAGGDVDTVVMNPPFGADRGSRAAGGDRVFLALAYRTADVVYTMHLARTERFLRAYATDAGFRLDILKTVPFPLPARFAHHRRGQETRDVALVRATRIKAP